MKDIINTISYANSNPSVEDFFTLFESTGWNTDTRKSKEELHSAICSSWYVVSAYAGNKLVGYGRTISDGYLHAFIADLIILPEYQGCGIGKEILRKLVDKSRENGINDIQLFCAKGKKEFYLKSGFEERLANAPGMQYRIAD